MSLILKIIAPSTLMPGQIPEYQFKQLGGSIGRKPNNDFILLDPERYISSKHAIIEYNHDKYYVTDTSTNGIYINNSKSPMGRGKSEELMNGDKISIGDFQLLVALDQETSKIEPAITVIPDVPAYDSPAKIDDSFYNEPVKLDENIVDPLAILSADLGIEDHSANLSFPATTPEVPIDDIFSDSWQAESLQHIPEPSPINEPFAPPNVIPDDWDIMGEAELPAVTPASPPPSQNIAPQSPDLGENKDIFDVLDNISTPLENASPPTPPAAANNELSAAIFKGLGISQNQLNIQNDTILMEKIGRLTRQSVEGIMIALRARATIKSNFRVNKTTISPVENNPLKFLQTPEETLATLLSDEKSGYMSADEALDEGFKDLQNHQMALMAGMQATINSIVHQFSPNNLEANADSQAATGLIPGQKKAKNWDSYTVFHAKISEKLMDDFQNVYGAEFAQAYEIQIEKLLNAGK